MNGAMRGNSRQWQLAVVEKCDFVASQNFATLQNHIFQLRTQNSELRTQNSELRTQNPELRTQN